MTEKYDPAADPHAQSLLGRHEATRHPVRPHTRTLPPKPQPPEDPDQAKLFDIEREDPKPRVVPVRPHTRRNPRRKADMTTSETIADPRPPGPTPIAPDDLSASANAREADPETSHKAARSSEGRTTLRGYQVWILGQFQALSFQHEGTRGEMIDHDLYRRARGQGLVFSESGFRTARIALVRKGLLKPTGRTRPTPLGEEAEVYALTDAGRAFKVPAYKVRTR